MKSEDNHRVACEGGLRLKMPEDGSRIPAFGLAALDFRNEFSEWRLQPTRSTLPLDAQISRRPHHHTTTFKPFPKLCIQINK